MGSAQIFSLMGDRDGAFRWVDQAIRKHAIGVIDVKASPTLNAIESAAVSPVIYVS